MIEFVKVNPKLKGNIDELVKSYKNLNIEQAITKMRTDGIADAEIKATLASQNYAKADIEQAMATKTNNAAKVQNIALTKAQTIWAKALTVGTKILNATLTMGLSVLISLATSSFISWLTKSKEKTKDLAEASKEANDRIIDLQNTLNNQIKTISEYSEEYAKLAQGINQINGQNISLPTEEYERFLTISNALGETFPELIKMIDENGNSILNLGGNIDSIINSLDDLIERNQRIANQEMVEKFPDIYSEYYNSIEKTNKEIDAQINKQEKLIEARNLLLKHSNKQINTADESAEYKKALSMFGIDESEYTRTPSKDKDGKIGYIYNVDQLNTDEQIVAKYNELFSKSIRQIQSYEDQLNVKLDSVKQTISSLLSTDFIFTNELDKNLQAGIMQLFLSFNPDNLPEYIDFSNGEEVYNYLKSIYLLPITDLTEEVQSKLTNIFNKPVDMSDSSYIKLVDDIQAYFYKNDIPINLNFMVADEKELQNRVKNVISNITDGDFNESQRLNDFIKGMNFSEIEMFIQVANDADSATEAVYLFNKALEKSVEYKDIDSDAIIDGLGEIRNAYNTVSGAIEQYESTKHLTLDTIESLLSLDKKYLKYLYDENGQLTLNTEAYNDLTKAKLNEMYISIINDAMKTVNSLESEADAAHYLKLKNTELEETNWDLAKSELGKAKAFLETEKILGNKTSIRESAIDDIIADAQKEVNLLKEGLNGMNFDDFYNSSNPKKESKEFSKEFDWINNSVENVERNITNLNDALSNATGFKERLSLYDDLIDADNKLIDTTKKATQAYEKEWIKASSKISESYKNKIISGETFSIETIANETVANNIDDAIQAYDNLQSMLQKHSESLNKKKSDKQAKIKVKLELEEAKLDIHSIIDEDSMSSIQLSDYIKEEELIKANILKYNLQLAKTDEEKLKLQKEYNQYLKDNQDLIYENNKQERDNKISFYGSRVQDIQNAIDLSETKNGQGTEKQYTSMNDYIQKEIDLERKNYDAALEMRNKAKYGTPEWEKYNQEIQTAQDNIYDLTTAQIENNRIILKLPIKKIEEANEKLQDQLDIISKYKGEVESAIGAASNIIQNQIDTLNKEKETATEYWDSQIKAINDQKDALTEANDEIKNQLALEKAQYEFEKAKGQNITKVYREGQGFVYEADQEAIRDAKENLDEQEYNSAIFDLDKQIESLEKSKEEAIKAIDNQINSLELYKERIDSITQGYQRMLELQQLVSLFGQDAIETIKNGDLSIIDDMAEMYNGLASQETNLQLQIEANEKAINQIETYAEKWNGSSKTIINARQAIEKVVTDNTKEIESIQQRTDIVKTVSDAWEETKLKLEEELGFIKDGQIIAKDEESIILGERLENIRSFATKASEYLKEITTALSQAESKQSELNKIANEVKNNKPSKGKSLTIDTMGKKHSGMESGYVGESNKKDKFKYIALNELNPDEIPAVLLKGEAVLSKLQQSNVLDNMKTSFISGMESGINKLLPKQKAEIITKNLEFNGDIILQNVNDVNGLASAIKMQLPNALMQELYKR